jgi:adenosine deaminase
VVGFGLTGNEHEHNPADFREAFRIAKGVGLGLTAHTGEWLGPRNVLETLEVLDLDRIGHGTRLVEDTSCLRSIADRKTGIEVCLTSNLALGAVDDLNNHPIKAFLAEGCRLSIATDDPGFFGTTPTKEFELASRICRLSEEQRKRIYLDSVAMALCDAATKSKLIGQMK